MTPDSITKATATCPVEYLVKSKSGKKLGEVIILPTKDRDIVDGRELLNNEVYCEITKCLCLHDATSFLPETNVILNKLQLTKIQMKANNKKAGTRTPSS